MAMVAYTDNVFINCPFDEEYAPIFKAIVFAIYDCGFVARCTLEEDEGTETRFSKIMEIIRECRYGVHDLSRVQTDIRSDLPRFNMPLELGVFIGARTFGAPQDATKKALIMDAEPYRYQQFISDLAGVDPKVHHDEPKEAVRCVRDWLRTASRRTSIPGASAIWSDYESFLLWLPTWASGFRLDPRDLLFIEYSYAIEEFLKSRTNT